MTDEISYADDVGEEARKVFESGKELHEKATGRDVSDEEFLVVLTANYADRLGIELDKLGDDADLNYIN